MPEGRLQRTRESYATAAGHISYIASCPGLRRVRQARNLSQDAVAEKTGFSQSYVSRLEQGMRPRDEKHIDILAETLGVPVASLLKRPPPL